MSDEPLSVSPLQAPAQPPTIERLVVHPEEPPNQSIDPVTVVVAKPSEEELVKMRAVRAEPFTVKESAEMPGDYKLIYYHTAPPWSWINPDGTKHPESYASIEEAVAAANEQTGTQ